MATPAEIELPQSSGLFLVLCLMHSTLVIGNTKALISSAGDVVDCELKHASEEQN